MVKTPKGWKKTGDGEWDNLKSGGFVDIQDNGSVQVVKIAKRGGETSFVNFKTRKQAQAFAIKYMRSHPNG